MAKRHRQITHIGYIRVSTDEQAESGLSMESQEEKVRAHAGIYERTPLEIVKDEASAKDFDRPGIQSILTMIGEGRVLSVTVKDLSRLTRSVRDLGAFLELIQKRNVTFVSVQETLDTSTAAGRLVVNMLGSVAQWEREAISERTKAALAVLKSRGVKLGTPRNMTPAARTKGVEASRFKAEAERIALMPKVLALRESGSSIRAIADELRISPTSVQRILRMNVQP
jgi:DNA invertase Pin-like site-specific DNA recombinase